MQVQIYGIFETCLSDDANALNDNARGNVIALDIQISQVLSHFRHEYPTVTVEKSQLVFTTLVQDSDPVGCFYAKLKRIVKLTYPTLPDINQNAMIRLQF